MSQTSGVSQTNNSSRKILIDRIDKLIHLVAGKFGREIAQAVEGNMSMSQFLVLRFIAQSGPARVSQIAQKMQVTSSAVTFLTDKLVDKELIGRKRDKTDRRVVLVFVTEKGASLLEELEASRRAAAERLLSNLSDVELSSIVTILDKLASSIALA
ncbi:MAG TPA: MarR family transcriptional regulator [Firmicutes bacterium]|nr:MarR family transcriptional regulator [Candidatus Fermentithermobacillaceae bacterium]